MIRNVVGMTPSFSLGSKGPVALVILGLAVAGAGCAAIFSSGPTALTFQSNPTGAQVLVNGVPRGTTPLVLELHADDAQLVTFRREGCADVTIPLETHVQAGFVVLDILAGIIGIAVDAGTGEWKEFNERTPYAQLDCGASGASVSDVPLPRDPQPAAVAGDSTSPAPAGEVSPRTATGTSFPAGRWSGPLSVPGGTPFQAAITLNEISAASPGGAVAGLATYKRGTSVCVYRLTVVSQGEDSVRLEQSLESSEEACAQGLALVLEPVTGGSLAATLQRQDGRVWATGLVQAAGCELIEGAWKPANCP